MALTLDKAQTALLLMDFQNDIIHENGAFKDAGYAKQVKDLNLLAKVNQLLAAARAGGVKVIHAGVRFRPGHPEAPRYSPMFQMVKQGNALVEGTWGAAIHDAIKPQAGESIVSKRAISAFAGSDLANILTASGVNTLLLAGVATNFVVEGTAREAADRGYNAVIVGDCCAADTAQTHDQTLKTSLPYLATITTLEEALAALR